MEVQWFRSKVWAVVWTFIEIQRTNCRELILQLRRINILRIYLARSASRPPLRDVPVRRH